MITFTLPIEAQPVQGGGKRLFVSKSGKPVFFKNKRTTTYLDSIRILARIHKPKVPLAGPLGVEFRFVMKRPGRLCRKADPEGRIWADTRPDWDNLVKGTQDALADFWGDDSQICYARVLKQYASKGEAPHITVTISPLGETLI
jgi:Holliday junction resolvase RusA-like endonuclease